MESTRRPNGECWYEKTENEGGVKRNEVWRIDRKGMLRGADIQCFKKGFDAADQVSVCTKAR